MDFESLRDLYVIRNYFMTSSVFCPILNLDSRRLPFRCKSKVRENLFSCLPLLAVDNRYGILHFINAFFSIPPQLTAYKPYSSFPLIIIPN